MSRRKGFTTWLPSGRKIERKWWLIDATDAILGRLSTRVATVLMGKHRPTYTPFLDTGDFAVVVNCDKIRFTGEKLEQRSFQRYSGYKGGQKVISLKDMFARRPEEVVRRAVQHMLPKTTMGRHYIKKLFCYRGENHPHAAQKPEALDLAKVRGGRIWLRSSSGEPAAANQP